MALQDSHTGETHWSRAVPGELTHREQVHIWRVPLDIPEFQKEQLLALLADDELERAVTRDRNVGIDIEQIRDDVDAEQISRKFFSEQEIRSMQLIPRDDRARLFFQIWTRKEAFIKALGKGVSFPLENCDVSLFEKAEFTPVSFPGEKADITTWFGQDLFPGNGYAAAVVVEGAGCDLSFWQ